MTQTDNAAQALEAFGEGPVLDAAEDMAKAFELAGDRIATALERAARSGELSFNSLAESVARDLARLAVNELITAPLQNLVGDLGSKLIAGAAQTKPAVTVNMTMSGAPGQAAASQTDGQIAARIAQAVALGQGKL